MNKKEINKQIEESKKVEQMIKEDIEECKKEILEENTKEGKERNKKLIKEKIETIKELLQFDFKEAETEKEIQQIMKENRKWGLSKNKDRTKQKLDEIISLLKAINSIKRVGIELSKLAYMPKSLVEIEEGASFGIGKDIIRCTNKLQKVVEKRIIALGNQDIIKTMKEQENNQSTNKLREVIWMEESIHEDINNITTRKTYRRKIKN